MNMQRKIAYSLFIIFIVAFILIVSKGLITPQPGDENAYYYMGKLVSEGKIPYKDFFFAHPPLQVYLIASIYKIFGFNIIILKSIPLISTLISAFFIFKITKDKFSDAEAVIASLLFLFSYGIMFNSVFSFGISVATMFLVIGVHFLLRKNYILAGIFFGLAGITRLLTLIPIFVILIMVLVSNEKRFFKLSSTFLIIFLLFNSIFLLFFGSDYSTPVYKYHLLKSFGNEENFREYIDIVKLNWILFLSFISLIFVKKKQISLFAVISIVYLIFLMTLKKIFGFYFVVAFPFLAICGGFALVNIYKKIKLKINWKILILIVLFLVFSWNLASDVLFLEKIGFTGFERGKDLIGFVNSRSNTLLFGDDSVVPLLALSTNKRIANDVVDTNNQVFVSGVIDLDSTLSELKGKDVLFLIRDRQGISEFVDVRSYLDINCEFLSGFNDKIEGIYLVYSCK